LVYLQQQGIDLDKLCLRLEGRVRFTIYIIQLIVESSKPVTQELIDYWLQNDLVNGPDVHSLATAVGKFINEHGMEHAKKEFAKLIIHYVAFGGIVVETGDADLLAAGFAEPLVYEALRESMRQMACSADIIYFGERILSPDRSSSAVGDLLDLNVAVAFLNKFGVSIYEFLFQFASTIKAKESIPEALKEIYFRTTSVIGTGHREALKGNISYAANTTLKEFICKSNGRQYYIPRIHDEKADGAIAYPSVLFLMANKFSGDGNVSTKEVAANQSTTDCSEIGITNTVVQCNIDIVIRVHVVLPSGANRGSANGPSSHPPGVKVSKCSIANRNVTEIVVNIDNTNLHHLFPPELANKWRSRTK